MRHIREDVHHFVAVQMDRTDQRFEDPGLCDYLADLARLFVNLLEEEARHQVDAASVNHQDQADEWRNRGHGVSGT